ncbi:zinc ABC transporter substrate-binding protein [Staphylococcus sp. ACRSN]|uniref:metal ABC transporter solute-binding protein, Zn/Mn family n=1 Tax=Staphylococcus sp. ACRSN TaxID=2918214 RepID=UPI001EF223A3|nr:zinc ABC transporter substrate-binding protein [Staphylococcus sp. ACRSN]MCG7338049.1 zinc ABC transporter substrate-binding protein [Staphylococcus sp. ACRSN]
MQKSLKYIVLIALVMLLSACGNLDKDKKKDVSSKNKLEIYTTAYAFQNLTEQMGGKYVDVKSIYPAGADIHSFEPTQKDMIKISKGDLFIYSSDEMDPVAKKIAKSINNKDLKLPLADKLNKNDVLAGEEHEHEHEGESHDEHEHAEGSKDPHVWLDPVLDKKFAKEIKETLIKKDPKHKKYYESNYKKVTKDIENVDSQLKTITKNPKRDTVVISHDSIGYLAKRYGFKQEGVTGMNNEEPTQKQLMKIVNNIKDTKQPYVLYEQNISSKVTDVIKKETNTTPVSFHNMATLTKEDKQKKDISYQSLMKKNIKALDKALNK